MSALSELLVLEKTKRYQEALIRVQQHRHGAPGFPPICPFNLNLLEKRLRARLSGFSKFNCEPKISIIVPCYNVAMYLPRSLESLINQSLYDIEIICIDDKSSDDTLQVLNEYAARDARIKVIALPKNGGAGNARNAGLAVATGEYLGFVDPDDYVDTDFYEKLHAQARQTATDIVKGGITVTDIDGRLSNKLKGLKFGGNNERIRRNAFVWKVGWWAAIYRKGLIAENHISFPVEIITGQDLVFQLRALVAARGKLEIVPDAFYRYILRKDSLSFVKNQSPLKIKSQILAARKIFDILNEADIDNNKYCAAANDRVMYFFDSIYGKCTDNESRRAVLAEMSDMLCKRHKFPDDFSIRWPKLSRILKDNDLSAFVKYKKDIKDTPKMLRWFANVVNASTAYSESEKIILCIDHPRDPNTEAIDAYSFFLYLQSQNIPSIYLLLRSNKLTSEVEALPSNIRRNVFLFDDDYDFFVNYELFASAKFIVTSFGIKIGDYEKLIFKMPNISSVFIEHGPTLFKQQSYEIYNGKKYNYVLVPLPKTRELYKQNAAYANEQMLPGGLPRWDFLCREDHEKKNIFMFFTHRSTKGREQEYFEKINSLINNQRLQSGLRKHNVFLKYAAHHYALYKNVGTNIENGSVQIVEPTSISKHIRTSDLLVTDYSSICFDFMYMNIPSIFYRFDFEAEYLNDVDASNHSSAKKFDDLVGNCVYSEEACVDTIIRYIESDFRLEYEVRRKYKQLFWKRGACNRQALLEKLSQLQQAKNEDVYGWARDADYEKLSAYIYGND